jgi:hypothetical protein
MPARPALLVLLAHLLQALRLGHRRLADPRPGAPPHVISEILGHAGITIAKRDFSIDDWIITAKGK